MTSLTTTEALVRRLRSTLAKGLPRKKLLINSRSIGRSSRRNFIRRLTGTFIARSADEFLRFFSRILANDRLSAEASFHPQNPPPTHLIRTLERLFGPRDSSLRPRPSRIIHIVLGTFRPCLHRLRAVSLFSVVRRAKRETREWPRARLMARDGRGTKKERLPAKPGRMVFHGLMIF